MDSTMFKYHDECGRIGFTEDMIEKKNEFYDDLDYHSKQRFNSFLNFIKVKNEKDDFSKVIYFGISSEIIIECKEHGEYNSTPYRYMKQNRCPYCGNKRMSRIEYETKLKNKFPYLNIIGEYINTKHDIKVKCTFCGGEKEINAGMLLNSKFGCNCLNDKKPYTKEEYEKIAFNKNLKVLEPFVNVHTPIAHECLKCGYKWKVFPSWITTTFTKCPKCSALNQSLTKRKSLDEINKKLSKDDRPLICLEYNGMAKNSKFKCMKCNKEWWSIGGNVINGGNGCPNCHSSSNETVINDWLTNHNIEYIREYKFNDCKNKQSLPFDFYIPKYGILIEMQGEQHFRPIKFRKTMSDEEAIEWFNYRQKLDNIKSSYAKEMGYTFVEIRFDEDIKDRLKKLFNYLL